MPEGPDGSMLSGTALAVMQRRADDELRQRLEFIRQAQIEAAQMAVAPAFISDTFCVRHLDAPEPVKPAFKGQDPRIVAEKLLRSVLPEDLCISLSAINQCEVQGNKHRYRMFKNQKTWCFQGDKTFSCCIQPSLEGLPDTDRIIAEYLLLTNDEEEYLKTANLTLISVPINIDEYRYAGIIRAPQITLSMICQQLVFLIRSTLRRRFPILEPQVMADSRYRQEILSVNGGWSDLSLGMRFDDMADRFLRPVAIQMARYINERPSIVAFFDLPIGINSSARVTSPEYGLKLSVMRTYDLRMNTYDHLVRMGALLL